MASPLNLVPRGEGIGETASPQIKMGPAHMNIRIVINGKDVESPIARFSIGLLAVVGLTLAGVVLVLVVFPLIGITLVLTFGIFLVIALSSLISVFVALAAYQHLEKKQNRLEKK